jgi:hypothetical protein
MLTALPSGAIHRSHTASSRIILLRAQGTKQMLPTIFARGMIGIAALVLASSAGITSSLAQQEQLAPAQVRSRILDICMVSMAREVSQMKPIYPACNCYATGLAKIMDANDVAAFSRTGQVPRRLTASAQGIYDTCRK